jgi:hypothetical protein
MLDGNAAGRHELYSTNANKAEAQFPSAATLTSTGTWGAAFKKIAASYKLNNFAMSAFGETVQVDTSGAVPVPTAFSLGTDYGGSYSLNGWLKRMAYLPWAVGSGLLQALST